MADSDPVLQKLELVAWKLRTDKYDIRHAVLDILDDFEVVARGAGQFPPHVATELNSIASELVGLKPAFPSHRKTSPLFSREGMGQKGFKLARDVSQRIIAVAKIALPKVDD
ncbi:MAG: hypothetical protein O3A00_11450 [Planctomycetota bacterium]|nr:hypothetical protein [Planctomycetota bacterium]